MKEHPAVDIHQKFNTLKEVVLHINGLCESRAFGVQPAARVHVLARG